MKYDTLRAYFMLYSQLDKVWRIHVLMSVMESQHRINDNYCIAYRIVRIQVPVGLITL
jgi:hypothetical protein